MELKQVLLPLIVESRKRFGNNSLLLVLDTVKICNQGLKPIKELRRKLLPESAVGLNNLELVEVLSGNEVIQGYTGEIHHWQTKACRNLDEILVCMLKIDNSRKLSSKILPDVSVWKKRNDGLVEEGEFDTVLCFSSINDDEYFVSDGEILTLLEYSLQTHFGIALQISVEEIEQIALPFAIFGQLWIAITEFKFTKINIKLYDFDGFECGYLRGIIFNSKFLKSIKKFPEETVECKTYQKTTKGNSKKDDCKNKSYPHDVKKINQRTQDSTDITNPSYFHGQAVIQTSESVTDVGNKLSIVNKIREAVEMISETECDNDRVTFISLGFDSLKLARLEFILQSEFNGKILIPYGSAHRYPSIDALSEYILENSIKENNVPENMKIINFRLLTEKLTKIIRSGAEIPLSAAQKRFIFLQKLDPKRKSNFVETLKFNIKSLKVRPFQKAFNRVIARHTALRTIYTVTGQTSVSLTEAYFSISIQSKNEFKLFEPIDLFDSSIPMRIFIIEREEDKKRENEKLEEYISNRIYQEKNVLIIQMHHIMIDGFSIKLLTDELHTLYYKKNSLKSTQYQYGHFVLLEDQRRQDSEGEKLREAFWQEQLRDVMLQTLPGDKTELKLERYLGSCLQFKVDSRILKCLQSLATQCCVTRFSVLLANFQLLQYKRYGFKDSCIGVTVAQRETPELCTVIGCLINVVPLFNTIDPSDRIHDFIVKSYRRLSESIQKQLQFDDLIAALHLERDLSNSPLFQVLFVLDDDNSNTGHHDDISDDNDKEEEDMKQSNEYSQNHDSNFAQYDQVWYLHYHKGGMTLKIEYNGNRFYKNTIEAMVQQYFRLLHKMSQNLHILVQKVKMISAMEELANYQLRIENRCDYPQKCTILDLVDEQNRMNPYCNIVIQKGVPFSSTFLQRKSNQLSRFLTQSWLQFLGEDMRSDTFILLTFDRSISLLLTIFALWKCGIGVAPLNPGISTGQLNEILAKLIYPAIIYECKRKEDNVTNQCIFEIVSGNSCRTLVRNSDKQKLVFRHNINQTITLISGYSDKDLRKKLSQHNLAYMTFSSGSTSVAKGICTEFHGLNNLLMNYAELFSIKSSSTIYQVVNPSFDIFFADILEAQTNGATVYLASQRIPDLEEMSKVTHAYIMPAYLSAIQSEQFNKLTNLEKINFGGDYINYKVLQDAIRIGLRFYNQYGMTEHSIYSSCKLMKVCDKTSSVGKPFKNIHFFICDSDRNLCAKCTVGICCASGEGISRGYYDNEQLDQISFPNNHNLTQLELLLNSDKRYLYSGDLAEIKNTVGELLFHGRSKFQVKIRGVQIDIPTIEAILVEHQLVKECVVSLQRMETEELLTAYIIPCTDTITMEDKEKKLLIKSLKEYILTKLPTSMIPNHYVFLQQLPLNVNGKIDRKLLPVPEKLIDSKIPSKIDYLFEAWEKQVMEIFAALLPRKVIQLDDSFFEVGGDSLKALIAIQNIKREIGIDLPLRDIFQLASFRAILERLKESHSTRDHRRLENSTKVELAKFQSHSLRTHNESGELTNNQLINAVDILTKNSNEFVDKDKTVSRTTAWKSNGICNEGKKNGGFWFNGSIPVSLQQERLLFLYSFGKEYRESYKLQFRITFSGHMNIKALNTALNYIMRKHRLLRTVLLQKAEKAIQEVASLSECYIEIRQNMLRYDGKISVELPNLYGTPLLAIIASGNLQLMLILDHLIVDGYSIAILTNDLVEFYNKLISGDSICFDATDDSGNYAEFCLKQRNDLEKLWVALKSANYHSLIDSITAKDEQHIEKCKRLEEMILKLQNFPPLSLQSDLSDEESDRSNNVIRLKLPLSLTAIKHFCMTERCTLFAYLLGIFSLIVDQCQQKDRFAVVTSALNRTSDTMNCVGLFVNTVIIPIDTAFESVSELIHNLQQNIVEALELQHIPFHYFIQKLNPRRSSTVSSEAYQISFVVQNASAIKLPKIDGVETIIEELDAKYAKFDQAWYFTEFEDYIELFIEYKNGKYSDLKIKHIVERFVQITSQILSNSSVSVKAILESKLVNVKKLMIKNDDNSEDMIEVQSVIRKNWMLEEALLSIWKKVLESSEISIFDNFFAIGGHSLLIPTICYQIEQQINYQCPPQLIFKYQTVRELAEYISKKQNLKMLIISNEKFKIPVCPLQESLVKMYYNEVAEVKTSPSPITTTTTTTISSTTTALTSDLIKAYQTGFSIALKRINLLKLRHSLNLIIMHHSALRTTFYCKNNNFFQEIHSGSEIYITPRMTTDFKEDTLIVPNPFRTVPILCWLIDGRKQERSDDNHCELHFKTSHVICDGKSLSIIARELYNHHFNGIQISMKDDNFIQFSKRIQQRFRQRHAEMQRFWSEILKDTEGVNLHYEKITASSSNRCKFLCKNFKNLNSMIIRVAKKCCCSPFAVQLAAFSVVLSKITTQTSKIAISCPVDMRDPEGQQCVGMCVNVLPVVINLNHANYWDLIQDVASNLTNAYVNADISRGEMEKLCGKYGISNFADVMIVNNYEEHSDHCYQILNDNSEFTKCVLTLFLTQHHENIVVKIEYKHDLFYGESMSIMLNQWARTIRRMEKIIAINDEMKNEERRKCRNDTALAGQCLSVKNKEELEKRNETENALKYNYPKFSYQHLLREAFVVNGRLAAKTALIGNNESINYRTLIGLIYRTSKILREKVIQITGSTLRADTVIAIIARNSIRTLITCLAIIMAGGAYLPIDSTSPAKRIADILEQVRAKFYVTVDEEFHDPLNFPFQTILKINLNDIELNGEPLDCPIHIRNTSNDLAYVIFTSGTTGKPKGVAIGQHGLLNMAVACTRDFWMEPGDCVYQFTNFAFDNSVLEIMMALLNGGALLLREGFFVLPKFLDDVRHGRITHALLFPGLVNTFTDEEIGELRHLRYWIVGAESAGKRILECALKSEVNVIQNYGPTETTAYALTKRMKLLDRPNNIGRGIINVVTTVRNFCGQILAEMGVGELWITGIGVTRGYIVSRDAAEENEKENKNKVVGTCCTFATRDIVRLQPNNDILFLRRYDKQVKIRGYRVELGEIEAILCQHPQIKSAKVIPKLISGQQHLAAFVILSNSAQDRLNPDTVRQFMLEHLPYYMVPTQYHFLQQYPITKNSKVDVAALEMLQNTEKRQYFKQIEPENSTEWKLLEFFRKVLQDDNITVNDDFFAVGGNSFSAAQLNDLIEANIAHCIGVNNVFRHRTVRRLSQYILHSDKKPSNERICEIQDFHGKSNKVFNLSNIPLSFQQQQFFFLNKTKQQQYYELIFVQKFDVPLSLRHLKLSFLRLILRQPSFRTIFPEQNYDVHQEILSGTEAYFYSNTLQSSFFPIDLEICNNDVIAGKVKLLQDEETNLKCEPPILCAVEAMSSASYTVILRINHIISDAWSTNLLENDLRDLYREITRNKLFDDNSRLPFTYAEYSIEQFEQKYFLEGLADKYADKIVRWIRDDPDYNNILENWERNENRMNQFDEMIDQNLDSAIIEEANQCLKCTDFRNYSEGEFTFEVRKIEKICGSFEITPLVAFLSAFTLSLHELSGTQGLIVNVPVANRSLKTNDIIGNFLNYLLIRSLNEVDTISTAPRNTTDSSANSIEIVISNQETKRILSPITCLKKYIGNINRTVNEIRQFEQVPFIVLLKLIRIRLKKLKSFGNEVMGRLHNAIFFNFRYRLEEDRESVLGKGETKAPTDCIREIEVEVDCVKSYYCCKIRMKSGRNSCKRILKLCQRMISFLRQMLMNSNIQKIAEDEMKFNKNAHEVITKFSSQCFRNNYEGNVVDLKLRRIWSECLMKKWIEDDDDFFLEGGTSLLTLKLKSLIESELEIPVELDEIFQYSTFTKLSKLLQKRFISICYSSPAKRIEFMKSQSERNNDLISQKRDISEASENQTTIRLFHQGESNMNITDSGIVIVFFHALVGGVTWTYASVIRQLVRKLSGPFRIIGVEHPDSFSRRHSRNGKFYHSIECLCSNYVRDLRDHLFKAKIRIFIGASFGATLAYQCAVQLQQESIHIDDIISIDGTAYWRSSTCTTELSSYEEHRQQIIKIVKYQTGGMKIDDELLEAMIENAWELLKMMHIYIPSRSSEISSRLHVTLLKSPQEALDENDYGWMNLCSTNIVDIPFSHDTMLHDRNTDTIAKILLQTIQKLDERQ
uniref:oleoyl-[acyl-carrier-protein] hydrolase n=1 Tax=Elaeophora elaphi TaxID=1147741 RepID=A0A0R3RTJ9_9BILA